MATQSSALKIREEDDTFIGILLLEEDYTECAGFNQESIEIVTGRTYWMVVTHRLSGDEERTPVFAKDDNDAVRLFNQRFDYLTNVIRRPAKIVERPDYTGLPNYGRF